MALHTKKAHSSPLAPILREEKLMAINRCITAAALLVAASLVGKGCVHRPADATDDAPGAGGRAVQ